MILDAIILENFGVYGGSQEVDLTTTKDKPIILFGGLNGGGKTTLLDALQLVFYGRKARTSNRGRLGYRDYLAKTIHRGVDPAEGASVAIKFRRVVSGKLHSFLVTRRWRKAGKDIEERLEVFRDGEDDPELAEHWGDYIEGFLPHGIAHLFFFDAEQIADLAEGNNAREMLRTGIHSLLGLDLIGRLEGDLKVLERKKRSELPDTKIVREADAAHEEVERLDRELEEVLGSLAEMRNKHELAKKDVKGRKAEFERAGGTLFERREELERQCKDLEDNIGSEEEALRHLAAGPAPLMMIPELLSEVLGQLAHDGAIERSGQLADELERRDFAILEQMSKEGLGADWSVRLESLFEVDRTERRKLGSEEVVLGADERLESELKHLQSSILPKCRHEIEVHTQRLEKLREEMARLVGDLARVPPEEAIAAIQEALTKAQLREGNLQGELLAAQGKSQSLLRQLEEGRNRAERFDRQVAEAGFDGEDQARILKHSQKVRDTLEQFRTAITRRHVAQIQSLMLESFTLLLRKNQLVKDLIIDPETFEVRLTGRDGADLPFDRLSAGERQLLATSLLWGLARASGRPIPTVIDTPLGRLDSSHRRHLVERYFPVAAHQVILLSTDEEIDALNLKRLEKSISKSYQLQHDDATGSTTIEEGYFATYEAAS